ncbi:MAG: hypothetical protein R3F59_26100 [Myxococcota bacterium]
MRSLFVATLSLLAACEVPPCGKDHPLSNGELPCLCEGVVIDSVDCGSTTCTAYGPYASTGSDSGCTSTSSSTTP